MEIEEDNGSKLFQYSRNSIDECSNSEFKTKSTHNLYKTRTEVIKFDQRKSIEVGF